MVTKSKYKNFTKKQHKEVAKFYAKVREYLFKIGAKKSLVGNDNYNYFTLPTIVGPLQISFSEGEFFCLAYIFGRFDNPSLAKNKGISCNPYSGKWNFSFTRNDWEQHGPDRLLQFYQFDLEPWLIK